MKPRLELLRRLLKDDGSIWISIDDDEQAYLKVLCDEVFGRKSFVASVVWQKRTSPDNDPRGSWTSTDCTAQAGHGTPAQFYTLTTPAGRVIELPDSLCWRFTKERMIEEMEAGRIWLGKVGMGVPRKKTYLAGSTGVVPWTWWSNKEAKKENNVLFGSSNTFATPKPERLIERIISIASNKGDLILDSFLGSGTTAAVAHKMGRRYIGIEMGDHAYTHCKVRLDKVIAGKDQGGITKTTDWQGGGGYRFYELAPTLINTDVFGEYVINEEYDADMLAVAVALHEGFRYQPDENLFWKQSSGNENSYLFVTTRHLNGTYLDSIKDTMQEDEYLIIACKFFDSGIDKAYDNIVIKKIPQMLLSRCEFGKDDYALNIIHSPKYEDEEMESDE